MKYFTFFLTAFTDIVFKLANMININIYDIWSLILDTGCSFLFYYLRNRFMKTQASLQLLPTCQCSATCDPAVMGI